MKAGARSRETEHLRRARVHTNRHLRVHQVETGGMRGEIFCDEVEWARVAPRIEARAKELWKAAGGGSEPLEAFRLDALIELLGGSDASHGSHSPPGSHDSHDSGGSGGTGRSPSPSKGSRCQTIVVIDAAALRRGTTEGDELCEIEGIGPVSVEAATELL